MREIKFRMWVSGDEEEPGYMISDDELAFEEYEPLKDLLSRDGIMQWTGLLDSKGSEVYEGDIVEAWFPGMPNNMRCKQEIMFVDGCFGCGDYPLKIMDRAFMLVLGNIHQNPDLLKEASTHV